MSLETPLTVADVGLLQAAVSPLAGSAAALAVSVLYTEAPDLALGAARV